MSIEQLNKYLQSLTSHSLDTSVTITQSLLQLMGINLLAQKETIINTSATLQSMLVENPIVKGQQLFFKISKANEPISCRLAVVKKINKQTIYRLVHENKFYSWQANIGNVGTDNLPYTIDFITNKNYQQLTVVLSQGEQIRTLNFNNRLTNLQVHKILPKWLQVAQQPKAIINADLWSSLDIKEVNKQFYITIKDKFDTLISNIQEQHPATQPNQQKMFAIKLIGRYLFCWFLKEKEIIPAQALSSNSLGKHSNIYNQIINPLFFITLNTLPQPEREYPSFVPQDFIKLFANIPYLNGGLFEESEEDKLINTLQIDTWLLQFIQFLEEYNFTVDESSPNYEQLAIDPEMLGRILENLLASLNTETEKMANERKSLGAFYTPRVIVDYMVTESLKYYLIGKLLPNNEANEPSTDNNDLFTTTSSKAPSLFAAQEPQQLAFNIDKLTKEDTNKETYIKAKIDKLFNVWDDTNPFTKSETQVVKDALQQCKIIDPACGSGAFPMGILHKLEMLNEKLGTDKSAYKLRRHILSQNIYGVDILPIAVEISRLRAWLSLILVSDFKPTDKKHNFNIEALPNLDFKFVCANSLVGSGYKEFKELEKLANTNILTQIKNKVNHLEEIRNLYFNSSNTDNAKKKLILDFHTTKEAINKTALLLKKNTLQNFLDKIDDWDPFNDSKASSFFSPDWMLGVSNGFDIVLGNPPYIQLQDKTKLPDTIIKLYQLEKFKSFIKTGDLYCLFYEKGVDFLNSKGILCYITSNKWMRAEYGKLIRKYFIENTQPEILIDFGQSMIFESAIVHSNILLLRKTIFNGKINAVQFQDKKYNQNEDLNKFVLGNLVNLSNLSENLWVIESKENFNLKDKIELNGIPLSKWKINFYRGILTGCNEAFLINGVTKKILVSEDKNNATVIQPILRGRDVRRYYSTFNDWWLINSHNGLKGKKIERINIPTNYPTIYEHLKKYINKAEHREDKGDHWTNLRNCAYLEEIDKPKIIFSEIVSEPQFHYEINKYFPEATVFFITGEKLKYLTALLNSRPVTYIFKMFYAGGELVGKYRYKKAFLERLPIPNPSCKSELIFEELVNKILAAKKENPKANTILWEREIDIRVCHLYNLTLTEAKLVDATITEEEFNQYKN